MTALPSAICGIVIGILYGLAGLATGLLAERFANFSAIIFGGMLVRLTTALAAVAFLISVMSVRIAPFFLSLLVTFSLALTIEIALLHNRATKAEKAALEDGPRP